jgi:dUTP pyrophosphatase
MSNIVVKFKKLHPDAVLPKSANENDTGYDLTAVEDVVIPARGNAVVPVGLQVSDVTPGYWYVIMPRSGLGFKHSLQPHLGVIDNGYRGSLDVKVYSFSDTDYVVKKGSRIAQLVFYPLISPQTEWSDEVTETQRGVNGFGSTGK